MICKPNNSTPFFSILIPSYNRPEYLGECLDSILASDFSDYEIIVSDDCSPQRAIIHELMRSYLQKDQRISYCPQEKNLGEAGNRNFLSEKANGRFHVILGDDDKLFSYTLSTLKRYINDFPGYETYLFGYCIIDEEGLPIYSRRVPKMQEISLKDMSFAKEAVSFDGFPFWFCHPATFSCRSTLERAVPESPDIGIGCDFLFLFNVINQGIRLLIIPEVLFQWRKIQKKSKSSQLNQSLDNYKAGIARHNIYHHLLGREDIAAPLREYVKSARFKKLLLDRPLMFYDDPRLLPDGMRCGAISKLFAMIQGRLRRTGVFIRLYGYQGFVELLHVLYQRFCYWLRYSRKK